MEKNKQKEENKTFLKMALKFYEQINEIAERIQQDESKTEKQKEQELRELNNYVRSVTD